MNQPENARPHFGKTEGAAFFAYIFLLEAFLGNAKNEALDYSCEYQSSCEGFYVIRLEHPLGTECITGRIYTVLLVIRYKVFVRVLLLTADFGGRNIQPRAVSASKSAVFSLLLSLHKQRK